MAESSCRSEQEPKFVVGSAVCPLLDVCLVIYSAVPLRWPNCSHVSDQCILEPFSWELQSQLYNLPFASQCTYFWLKCYSQRLEVGQVSTRHLIQYEKLCPNSTLAGL